MKKHRIKGATDITGFGLAGHTYKMARASGVSITLNMDRVPLIGNTYKLLDEGCIPGASFRNLDFVDEHMYCSSELDYNLKMAAFDAQTSGGLLMSVVPEKTEAVLADLHKAGLESACIIGSVNEKDERYLHLNS